MELLEQLRDLAPWHFDIEVADGVRTSDGNREYYKNQDHEGVSVVNPFEMESLLMRIYPGGLTGKRFLDVGCNSGGYCFVAKKLGATSAFGFDVRDHWIRQANFLKKNLNASLSGVEFRVMHLSDLDASRSTDITLFKGVFYHVPDPIYDLRTLCDLTAEIMILDTMTDSTIPEHCLGSSQESLTHLMSGVDGLHWLPGGPKAVEGIFRWAGFPELRQVNWQRRVRGRHRGRMRLIAARSAVLLEAFDRPGDESEGHQQQQV